MNPTVEGAQFEADILQILQRTRDVKSIRLRKPEGFDYFPGQWISVTLANENEQKTKPLSLSSSPTEDFLEITKRLTGHDFSNALEALKVGDKILFEGPFGNLTFQGDYSKICMLSGGIGITPLRSMIRYSIDKGLKTDIVLIYSNRHEDSIAFEDDFKKMHTLNPSFKMIITITKPSPSWKGLTGRINRKMIEETVPDYENRIFYTCGPKPMVDAMRKILSEIGLTEEQVKYEYFTGYLGAPSSSTKSA
ncbi:MAG: FAD-dependent oxidoreductase [Methanotrichaceae archaeon]|nr:FAD-dependent oxidoreductase [Methanotrichaceae archaeon]